MTLFSHGSRTKQAVCMTRWRCGVPACCGPFLTEVQRKRFGFSNCKPFSFALSVICKQRGSRPHANHVIPVNKKLSDWDGSVGAVHWRATRRAFVCVRPKALNNPFRVLRRFLLSWACNAAAAFVLAHPSHVAVGLHNCANSWPECLR